MEWQNSWKELNLTHDLWTYLIIFNEIKGILLSKNFLTLFKVFFLFYSPFQLKRPKKFILMENFVSWRTKMYFADGKNKNRKEKSKPS